jgi:hypothetical protein
MSSSVNTVDTLNGFFKKTYTKEGVKHLIPDGVKLYTEIKFNSQDEAPGESFNISVALGLEHGMSWGAPTDGAFSLQGTIAGMTKEASIRGYQKVLRSSLSYSAASRALAKGEKAFESSSKFLVGQMLRSVTRKIEIELFYGQMGYGAVSSASGNDIVVTLAEWAPGIWVAAKNMPIQVRSAAGVIRGQGVIDSVDMETRTLTLDTNIPGVIATDVIYHTGAYGKEFAGIHKILSNTGELFGISAAEHNLWKGNSYNCNGALSFAKIQLAIAQAIPKGLEDDVKVFINPKAWANLMNDQAALREFDSSYKKDKMENGARALLFHGQTGMIEICPSIYVKEGFAYVLSMREFSRIGSTDVTFELPGSNDKFFRELSDSAGYELRCYTDQALFCRAPGVNVLIYGIVNSL